MSYFDQQKKAGQNLTSNSDFTIRVPEKNACLISCHRFQDIIICLNDSVEHKKKFWSMPISSDLASNKPKWINGLVLGFIIGLFALIINPRIEKHKT